MIRTFEERDRASVIDLWRRADLLRPWNDPDADIDRKLATSDDLLFVATIDDELVGTVMVGYDGHRGWINYLAVDANVRRAGVGRLLMTHAERVLADLGCAKVNLQVRTSNVAAADFYERLGYEHDDVVSMGKRLIDDEQS
ncbi:MAG: GNAT family acetyltransferase [Ilumatobacter sp.]|uniref:GNAT family acetyltransferase n=1 Tax=Ilumatobacter sp. TaxID=1967498 RepID=UPI00391BAF88